MMLEYVIVLTWSHGQDVERKNKINNNTVKKQSSFLLLICWHNTQKVNYRDSCLTYEETRPIISHKHKHREEMTTNHTSGNRQNMKYSC